MEALEQLRRRAVDAVESGIPQTQVARLFGVSRKSVGSWVRAYRSGGESTFRPRPRGRRSGDCLALSTRQQAHTLAAIAAGPPNERGIPCLLWTRRAVTQLVHEEFGISLAGSTVDRYLLRWQLIPAAPLSKSPDCPPGAALLTWTNPMWPGAGDHVHALVATSHRGLLYFLAAAEPFTASSLTEFAHRLRMQLSRDVPLHVRDWPPEHTEPLAHWRSTVGETMVS
ncbi:MAG TPA: helix-turn-helix domain-containing protein [Amycolatopsis sp.]|nr:helix-turn-helix domain-containing protein [Amycolatopsis sp.]